MIYFYLAIEYFLHVCVLSKFIWKALRWSMDVFAVEVNVADSHSLQWLTEMSVAVY